jgi:hypothetical protein
VLSKNPEGTMWILVGIGVALLIVGGILLWMGRSRQNLVDAIQHAVPTPAGKIAHALPGELVAVTGIARSNNPMFSQRGGIPCLYFSSTVERDYERTEYTPATKNQSARTSTHRSTEIMSTDEQSIPFEVEDQSGSVRVLPDKAAFDAKETLNRFDAHGSGGSGMFSIGGFGMSSGDRERTLGYRYHEETIALNEPVYVVGVVTESGEIARPRDGRERAALIVSYRDRDSVRDEWQSSARWRAYGSISAASIGIVLLVIAASLAIR